MSLDKVNQKGRELLTKLRFLWNELNFDVCKIEMYLDTSVLSSIQ